MTGFLGLDIALRSLMAHQRAMEVVSHNIANVNTPGYSRQEPVFTSEAASYSAMSAGATEAGRIGMGVRLSQIRRVSADSISRQVRLEKQSYNKWAIIRDTLQQIEAIISEPSEGSLSAVMDEFWAAWRDLSVDPQSTALRANVYERSASLVSTLNTYSEQLASARRGFNELINDTVQDVNDIVQELAKLNVQIVGVLAVGDQPNDLRDRRDLLLDTLSELVDVTITEEENGTTTVFLKGRHLVMWGEAGELATVSASEDPTLLNIVFQGTSELVRVDGGKLAGIIEARDSVITDVLDDLDTIAATLITQVNDVHAAGYGLDGVTGRDFFEGSSAADIALSSAVADVSHIAAASADPTDPTVGGPGDGSNATAIAQIADALVLNDGRASIGDYYRSMVVALGLDADHANQMAASSRLLVDHLEGRREQVSGVSLDEETVDLIRYQRAYQAAARLVSVINEMLDDLIALGRG